VTLYDGGSILADLDSVGNRQTEYIYDAGTDRPYALVTGAGTVTGVQYFVMDDFGNVAGTVTDSVTITQSIGYSDWGLGGQDKVNRLSWKGRPFDDLLHLTWMRARWYDPIVGRFVSEDPIGLAGGINPYVFANNDPINGRDPSGLSAAPDDWTCVDFSDRTVCINNGGGGDGAQPLPTVPIIGLANPTAGSPSDSGSPISWFFPTFSYKPTGDAKSNTPSVGPAKTTTARKSLTACLVASTGAGLAVGTDFAFGVESKAVGVARAYGARYLGISGARGLAGAKSVTGNGIVTTSMFINSGVAGDGFSLSSLAQSLTPFLNSIHATKSAYHACNQAE